MSALVDWALAYASRGWPVLPLHAPTHAGGCSCGRKDCSSPAKHPRTRNGLKDAATDADTIRSWWGRWPEANIGLRTGVAFDVLDVDGDRGFEAVSRIEAEHQPTPPGPTCFTGGGGLHRMFAPTGAGNKAGLLDHVDWRGVNGYIVAAPSLHITGGVYEWHAELDINHPLPEVTGWLHQLLFPPRQKDRPYTPGVGGPTNGHVSPYARRAFDAELGELARAGHGTRNHTLNDCAFNLYQLAFGGELDENEVTEAVTRVAIGIGLGEREISATMSSARTAAARSPRSAPALAVVTRVAAPAAPRQTGPGPAAAPTPADDAPDIGIDPSDDEEDGEESRTGWEPVDVAAVIAAGCHIPPPEHYQRSDGVRLLYAGKIHAFNGEPESGKSWAAQHASAQALGEDKTVCYVDFEDSPESVIGRLLALGVAPEVLTERFTYVSPDRPLGADALVVLRQHFAARKPHLVIIDGMTEAMSIFGLDPLDNKDSAQFFRLLPRRFARLGATVVIIDHVVKDSEDRGRWAIGAQHKMAALTGAAFTVDVVKPFGRNKAGFAKITVTKDRPGYIRQHAAGAVIAELHLISDGDGLTADLKAPLRTEEGEFRPTAIMEQISKVLKGRSAMTGPELEGFVKRRKRDFLAARRLLVDEGYVSEHKSGNSTYYGFVKPYLADDDPRLKTSDEAGKADDEPF